MTFMLYRRKPGCPIHYSEGFSTRAEAESVKAKFDASFGNLSETIIEEARFPGIAGQLDAILRPYRSEMTPEGEQLVIPGCERNCSPKAKQLDLF